MDANTAEEAEQKAREFAREVHGLQTVHILKVEPIQEHINPG